MKPADGNFSASNTFKIAAVLFLIVAVVILLLLSRSCDFEATSNFAVNTNRRANVSNTSNSRANNVNESANMSNSATNTSHIGEVTFEQLKLELKNGLRERIRESSGNEKVFTPSQWNADAWLNQTIGRFYNDDDDYAKKAVCSVTERVLKEHNKKMKGDALPRLRDSISHGLMCSKVVSYMQDAAVNTESIVRTP